MKYGGKYLLFYMLVAVVAVSCKSQATHSERTVNRSIYYWQTVFRLSDFEKQRLDELKINTIYLKFFDVGWNSATSSAMPLAQVKMTDTAYLLKKNIIPTIFITNECILEIDSLQALSLAHKITVLIKEIARVNHLDSIREIQIDCDWTATSKEKYFALLRIIRQENENKVISATIRLHQVKYLNKTGVPPVQKGLLMCYNMGNLKEPGTRNSIIEAAELKKYVESVRTYPLPLDAAFPIFEWNVLIRNGRFAGLMESFEKEMLDSKIFLKKDNRYEVAADTILHGYMLKKGDFIREEKSGYEEVLSCGKLVSSRLKGDRLSVSLYHLDSLTLSKYSAYELENIYNSLR